jgi:hypothetical protein
MPHPGRDVVMIQERSPNTDLIGAGAVTFGLTYGASIVAAAASERESDQNLFIPVAGPWMALVGRGNCPGSVCPGEPAAKVLLVTDGVLQGLGVLQIAAGFLFPQTRTVTRAAKVHVAPTVGGGGAGISAWGSF